MRLKLLLLFLSTILSFALGEVILRIGAHYFSQTTVFQAAKIASYSITSVTRDRKFELMEAQSNNEILCLGDSYTNNGNVPTSNSYPFQLWQQLGGTVTVRNMGVCESSSSEVVTVARHFVDSDLFSPKKHYTLLYLAGAADIFAENLEQKSHFRDQTIDLPWSKKSRWHSIIQQSMLLKTIQYLVAIGQEALTHQIFDIFIFQINNQQISYDQFVSCISPQSYEIKNDCFRALSSTPQQLYQFYRKYFQNLGLGASDKVLLLNSILHAKPQLLTTCDQFLMDLLANFTLQSSLSIGQLDEMLAPLVPQIKSGSRAQAMINSFKQWKDNYQLTEARRLSHLEELLSLSKAKSNLKLILMTYPLAYPHLNQQLRDFSNLHSLTLIDLEKAFSLSPTDKERYNRLIDDWEHCTPEGYKLMATVIAEALKKINHE